MWTTYALEEIDPEVFYLTRRRFKRLSAALVAIGVGLAAVSGTLAANIPYSPDIYGAVYRPVGFYKPEGTYPFLFVYPAFIILASIALWLDPSDRVARMCKSNAMSRLVVVWIVAIAGGWAWAAVSRDIAVFSHYFQ